MKYWLGFSLIKGFGPVTIKKIYSHFSTMEEAWKASENELKSLKINRQLIDNFLKSREKLNLELILSKIKEKNINIIAINNNNYPFLLKKIKSAPPLLFYCGKLPKNDEFCLAVVGSRKYSEYGKRVTQNLVASLIENNVKIVSGMAIGIDTLAHKSSIEKKALNFAVLGSSLDNIYPKCNFQLANKIINNGGLISEYPFGIPARPQNFWARNRIISGLCHGVLIVEADFKSGTLITANHAIDQGREVFCVPGEIFSRLSRGNHELIKQGAKLVTSVDDILEEFQFLKRPKVNNLNNETKIAPINVANLTKHQNEIIQLIMTDSLNLDQIISKTKLSSSLVLSDLTHLELLGLIKAENEMYHINFNLR